jgi:hypothetical protein
MAVGGTILVTLTGLRNFELAARNYDRAARARLRRVLVDEPREARHEHTPEADQPPRSTRSASLPCLSQATAETVQIGGSLRVASNERRYP